MRRKDKEVTDIDDKIIFIGKCKVCRIGLSENNMPYIVPVNFGYDYEDNTLTLYFHSAKEGRKTDIIKNNNNACFEVDCDHRLIKGETACDCSYAYKSVIGFGKIIFLEDTNEKTDALNKILMHQTDKENIHTFPPDKLKNMTIYKLVVDEFTGKRKDFLDEIYNVHT